MNMEIILAALAFVLGVAGYLCAFVVLSLSVRRHRVLNDAGVVLVGVMGFLSTCLALWGILTATGAV